jgi:hypothetical protein
MQFRDARLNQLVKEVKPYGNLVINDITDVKQEKPRKDGDFQRKYYVAYPASDDNMSAARGVTMWQDHTTDRQNAVWKTSPNPARLRKLIDNGEECRIGGYVVGVQLNQPYSITDSNGVSREVSSTKLYITHLDEMEKELLRFFIDVNIIEKEPVVAD